MKTVLILRHAKSSWDDPLLSDFDRPLNKRGRKDAPRLGEWLRQQDLFPDLILGSSAARARETVEALVEHAEYLGPVELSEEFYDTGPETWLDALVNLPEDIHTVLLVGHNPTLEELVFALSGTGVTLPTAALAEIALPLDAWEDLRAGGSGRLVQVRLPREK